MRDVVVSVLGKIVHLLDTARGRARKPARDVGDDKTGYVRR